MSEPAAHPVPDHRAAHRAAYHEPDPGRLTGRVSDQQVRGQQSASRPAAAPHRQGEIRAAPHTCLRGKHQRRLTTGLRPRAVRRSAARASCACAQRAPPARRGCACAGGIRASSHGGDCSAEMYACSLRAPDAVLWLVGAPPARRSRPTARAAASAAPARWPVDQGKCRDPGGQTGLPARGPPGADAPVPEAPGSGSADQAPVARAAEASPEPAGYRNTAIYRTHRKRDA
jgi:hypothetical protein